MTTSSEPPSPAFTNEAGLHSEQPSTTAQAGRSTLPLATLLSSITTPLNRFERVYLSDSREVMRDAVMHMQHLYCLVFASPGDAFPLGYVARKALVVELLTGNRPDVLRLVTIFPCLPVSISVDEALRVLIRKHAELGVLCGLDGAAIGLCGRESLGRLAENCL